MKNILLLLIAMIAFSSGFATHLIGGEITYEFLDRPSSSEIRYKVQVHLIRDCANSDVGFDQEIQLGVYEKSTSDSVTSYIAPRVSKENLDLSCGLSFFYNNTCLEYALYEVVVTLNTSEDIYTLTYSRCCRNQSNNLVTGGDQPTQGITYIAEIPTNVENNTSKSSYIRFVCANQTSYWDPIDEDPDGDSIVYENARPFQGGDVMMPIPKPTSSFNPKLVRYNSGYNSASPFGVSSSYIVDSNKVNILGSNNGQYDVAFKVSEYRNGSLICSRCVEAALLLVDCPPNSLFNKPYDLKLSVHQPKQARLEWKNCENNVDYYRIYRKNENDTAFVAIDSTNGPIRSFIDTTISGTGEFIYYVEGVSSTDSSGISNYATIGFYNLSNPVWTTTQTTVYPNPTNGMLFIKTLENIVGISIISLTGEEVLHKNLLSGKNVSLDLNTLSSGIYYISIRTNRGVERMKIVKK